MPGKQCVVYSDGFLFHSILLSAQTAMNEFNLGFHEWHFLWNEDF